MSRNVQLHYFAGLLDGEGHFYVANHRNGRGEHHKQARIVIGNTDKAMVDWLKSSFGGYVYCYLRKGNYKPYFRWQLVGKKAEALALEVRPYLITKKEQSLRLAA